MFQTFDTGRVSSRYAKIRVRHTEVLAVLLTLCFFTPPKQIQAQEPVQALVQVPEQEKTRIPAQTHDQVSGKTQTRVVINEVQASNNATLADEDGDYEDWIELYNAGEDSISLHHFGITDRDDRFRWVFPDTTIAPGQYLLIWASGKDRRNPGQPLHTNFSIPSEHATLRLGDYQGELIDSIRPTPIPSDFSYGRYPDGSEQWYLFGDPTPGEPNSDGGFEGLVSEPTFSKKSGFYRKGFELSIMAAHPDDVIHFTLDGSEPTTDSPVYEEPLPIDQMDGNPVLANIVTSPHHTWNAPSSSVFKGHVVRAIAVREGLRNSEVATGSWFIDPEGRDRYSFPVISIVTDSLHLFSDSTGIMVPGDRYDPNIIYSGNYFERGRDSERPAHMTFFDREEALVPGLEESASGHTPKKNHTSQKDHTINSAHSSETGLSLQTDHTSQSDHGPESGFSQNIGLRIHGGATRRYPQKSLRIYSRSDYDWNPEISYPIIPGNRKPGTGEPLETYKRLILRSSGDDWFDTMFKDAMIQSLYADRTVDRQAFRPSVVFVNGEYWGIHNIRDRYDGWNIETRYGIHRDDVVMLETNAILGRGDPDDSLDYISMREYAVQNDLSEEEHYDYISTQMDIDNYLEYIGLHIYAANADWPHNNIRYWRKRTEHYEPDAPYGADGRWRWMIFDLDAAFGYQYEEANAWWAQYDHNMLEWITGRGNPRNDGEWVNALFNGLIENETFRNKFIALLTNDLNTRYRPESVIERIEAFRALYETEIEEHINRYPASAGGSVPGWHAEIDRLTEFAQKRPEYLRNHLEDFFNLPGTVTLDLEVSGAKAGHVGINGTDIHSDTPGVPQDYSQWSGTYFKGVPVVLAPVPIEEDLFLDWKIAHGNLSDRNDISLEVDSVTGYPVIMWTPEEDLRITAVFDDDLSAGNGDEKPHQMAIQQNYPNPFNNFTNIPYTLNEKARITVDIYSVTGRHIRTFHEGRRDPGEYLIRFDASGLASGVYLYRMSVVPDTGTDVITPAKKMMLIR